MKTVTLEEFLGVLYADSDAQKRFRRNPAFEARLAGLSKDDCEMLLKMDWGGFELACRSFARKRNAKTSRRPFSGFGSVARMLRRVFGHG